MDGIGFGLAVAAILTLGWLMAGGSRPRSATNHDRAPAVRHSDDVAV